VTILSERRRGRPYGARGGEPGQSGRNTLVRADHPDKPETLPGKIELQLHRGDRVKIETPGGGGYGPSS
jgi:N-methylhydantoinase B/oxoprolinase/acetone carboxylase alpha subunit